jgi:hypothetical protein
MHWRQPSSGFSSSDDAAIEYASRIVTIPGDHRYRASGLLSIVKALKRGIA